MFLLLLSFICFRYGVYTSSHLKLSVGDKISLVAEESSISGVSSFYAQICSDNLKRYVQEFATLEVAMTEYGNNCRGPPNQQG